uniref:Ionotropic glutamate kainate receptor 2-like b n=1 Tax=Caligus rogercresseyi TaxID=217165 RepID=X2IYQ8_CALRO|nr:ionotropic glutamate kainate receptor 2-like b [Caligus rogercresseyi]
MQYPALLSLLLLGTLDIAQATLPLSVRIGVVLPQKTNEDEKLDNFLRATVKEINEREDILNATQVQLQVEYADESSLYETFHKACELLKYQAITIIGSNSRQMDRVLSSTFSNYHVPYLSIHPKASIDELPSQKDFSLSLAPSAHQISDPIFALAKKKGWKKVGIVYHKVSGILDPGHLTETFQILGIQPVLFELRTSDIRAGLKDLQEHSVDGFVVDIKEKFIAYFLRKALETGIVRGGATFIFTSLNVLAREKEFSELVKFTGASIIGLSPIDREIVKEKLNPTLDIEKGLYRDSLLFFVQSLEKLTSVTTPEGMSCQDPEATYESGPDVFESMKTVELSGVTGLIGYESKTNLRKNPILNIYELQSSGSMKKIGQWRNFRGNLQEGLTLFGDPNKLTQTQESTIGQPLRIGVIMKYGINSTEHQVNSYFDVLVFKHLAKGLVNNQKHNLNISLHYYHPKLHSDPHKSEERLAKFIKRKNLDLILGPFGSEDAHSFDQKLEAMELKVQSAVSTSHIPFLVSNMSELTLSHKSEISLTSILSASPFFWLNIIGLYAISSILLFGIVRLSPYSRVAFEKSSLMSILGDCFWFLLPPGLPATAHKIRAPSSRIFILTYFIFTMEVFFIIAISFAINIQGASRASVLLATPKGDSLPEEVLKIENGLYSDGHYRIPQVEWRVISRHFEPCLIQERSLEELITYRAIFPRGSPWAANFSRLFGELHEEGKLQALQETWFSKQDDDQGSDRCSPTDNAHINKHILWITLGVGYILSVFTALLEMCVYVFQAHDSHNPEHYSRSELISTEFQKIFESKDSDIHHRVGESMERSPPMQQRFLTTM